MIDNNKNKPLLDPLVLVNQQHNDNDKSSTTAGFDLIKFNREKNILTSKTNQLLKQLRGGDNDNLAFNNNNNFNNNQWNPNQQQQGIIQQQQEQQQQQSNNNNNAIPEQENGMLATVSKGSRALIFFIFMWRNVHLYEVADTTLRNNIIIRLMVVLPLCLLFLANCMGALLSLFGGNNNNNTSSASHASRTLKTRLKAILNLDKLVEVALIMINLVHLILIPSTTTTTTQQQTGQQPREALIANILHSIFFILQGQAFTSVTWDEVREVGPGGTPQTSSFYPNHYYNNDNNNDFNDNYQDYYTDSRQDDYYYSDQQQQKLPNNGADNNNPYYGYQ